MPVIDTRLVAVILDAFLDWVKANKANKTYTWHRDHIQNFVSAHPPTLTVAELKPHHVTRVMDAHEGWSPSTKNGFGRSVQQAFRWAKRQGLIEVNPIDDIEEPGGQAREMAISPAEYARIMEAVTEPTFRLLLETAWETGARPQELRAIEARHVDFEQRRIAFPVKESKGKKRQRIIYLTDEGIAILKPLCRERPTGTLLRNSDGEPWTKDAINCAFCRLQLALGRRAIAERGLDQSKPGRFKKEGIEAGKIAEARAAHRREMRKWHKDQIHLARELGTKYHLGAFRKGYATEALKNGVDVIGLSHLLGHADATMLSKVYAKVHQDPEFMAGLAEKARKTRATGSEQPSVETIAEKVGAATKAAE